MGQWKWHLAIGVVGVLHQNSQELHERKAWKALHESRCSNRLYDALTSALGARLQRYLLSSVDTATRWYVNALPRPSCRLVQPMAAFYSHGAAAPPQRPGFV